MLERTGDELTDFIEPGILEHRLDDFPILLLIQYLEIVSSVPLPGSGEIVSRVLLPGSGEIVSRALLPGSWESVSIDAAVVLDAP